MGSQAIGEVNVQITGDYSQLSDDLAQAQSIAAAAGGKVAQSFTGAAKSTDELTDSLGRSRAASEDEVNALGAAADKVNNYTTAIENALGPERDQLDVLEQMPKSYTEMTAAQQASIDKLNEQTNVQRGATDATNQAKDAIGGLAGGAESGANAATAMSGAFQGMNLSVGSTVKSLAAFAGIQISITALKNAVEEALTSFAQLQRATESLTALEGSAKLASDAIVQLRQLAQDEALSFPSLLKADQQMAAFGLSTKQAVPLLAAAGDASRATGKDFDSVANSLERIVESGMAMGRTLVNVGLTTKDLGGAMGVTADQASKLFKSLDESTRVEVITAALGKFKGVAHDTADDLSGTWTQLGNTANREFQRVGKELEPLTPAFTKFATAAIHALGGVADFFINFVNTIVQKGGELANYLKNQAVSWGLSFDNYATASKKAADSNAAYEESIGTMAIAAERLFNGFPEYQDKLVKINAELTHGEINGSTYAAKLEVLRGSFLAVQQPTLDAVNSTKSFTDSVTALKTQLDAKQISQAQYETSIKALIAAHGDAAKSTNTEKAALQELAIEYKNWAHGMDQAGTSMSALLGYQSNLTDATQTYLGTAKQQADAFQSYVVQSVNALSGFNPAAAAVIKSQTDLEIEANKQAAAWNNLGIQYGKGEVDQVVLTRALDNLQKALNAAGINVADLDVKLKPVGDTILVVAGGVSKLQTVGVDFSATIDGLNKQLGQMGVDMNQVATGSAEMGESIANAQVKVGESKIVNEQAAAQVKVFGQEVKTTKGEAELMAEELDGENGLNPALEDAAKSATDATVQIEGLKTGLDAASGTFDIHKGKVDSTRDAYGMLKEAATEAYNALVAGGTSSVQVFTDLNQIVDATGGIIDQAMQAGVKSVSAFDQAIQKAHDDWDAFQQSFAEGPSGGGGAGGKKGKKGASAGSDGILGGAATDNLVGVSFQLSNPYWGAGTPDDIAALFQNTLDSVHYNDPAAADWFYTNQYTLEQAALQEWWKTHPGYDSAGNPPAPRTSSAPPASTPTAAATAATAAPALPPDVQAFIAQLQGLSGNSFLDLGGGNSERVSDLLAKTITTGLIPPEAVTAMTTLATGVTALGTTLTTSTSTLATSFAALTPVMQTATAQVTAAIQQQAASFQTLSTALAPLTAPAPTPYSPASFSREGTPSPLGSPLGGSTVGTVNNLTITPTPQIQTLLNSLMQELQRQGIRF